MSEVENSSIENNKDKLLGSRLEQTNFDITKGKFNQLINQLDEKKREEIKPEFKEISKRFQSCAKFLEFTKFVVKKLNGGVDKLNRIQQRQAKTTILESLYSEFWSHQLWKGKHTIKDEGVIVKLIDESMHIGERKTYPEDEENEQGQADELLENTIQAADEWNRRNIDEGDISNFFIQESGNITETFNNLDVTDNIIVSDVDEKMGGVVQEAPGDVIKETEKGKPYFSNSERQANKRFKDLNIPEEEKKILEDELKKFAGELIERFGTSSTGGNLLSRFLISNIEEVESTINNGGRTEDIKKLFFERNEKKYENINESFFNIENLVVFSTSQQILKLRGGEMSDKTLKTLLDRQLEGMGYNKENLNNAYTTYQNFTLEEIVGELILNYDLNDADQLKKIQIIAGCFSNSENILNIKNDGIWGPQTYAFFKMLQDHPGSLENAPRYSLYKKKIDEILNIKPKLEGATAIYDSFDNVKKDLNDYWGDPRQRRRFGRGRMREHRRNGEIEKEYQDNGTLNASETEFIKINQNAELNQSLRELFAFNRESSRKERFDAQQRILSILPKDKLEELFKILPKRLKNIKRISEDKIFGVLSNVVNGVKIDKDFVDDETIFIYESIRRTCGKYIGKEIIGIIGYLKNQAGISAIQVRDQLLEGALNFEITQLGEDIKRDDPEKGIFYFRDKNHLETTYIYNAKTGEIYNEEKIVREDGIISFNGSRRGVLVHVIPSYDVSLSNINVAEVIGLNEGRASTTEELKERIAERIKDGMQYTVGTEKLGEISEVNEKVQEQNGIISNLGKIFNIGELAKGGELRKSEGGPYYAIVDAMINSFELCSSDDLREMNDFLIKIVELKGKIDAGVPLDEASLGNPILGFIIKNTKNIEALKGHHIKDDKLGGERRGEDIVYASIFGKLLIKDSGDKNIIDVETCSLLNNLTNSGGSDNEYLSRFEGYLSELEQKNIKNREDEEKQKDEKSAESLLREIGEEE